MISRKRKTKALKALTYDLFTPEILTPPAPATINTKVKAATDKARAARSRLHTAEPPGTRTSLPSVDELYRLFDYYNWKYFGGKLPRARIEYSSRMAAAGSYSVGRHLIRIGRKYHELFPQDIEDTLKHEMIHIRHQHHDAAFKREADRIGASLRAREHPALRRPPKYIYECPGCGMEYPRQKRLVMASCGKCSRGHRFDPRFKLRRKKVPAVRPSAGE